MRLFVFVGLVLACVACTLFPFPCAVAASRVDSFDSFSLDAAWPVPEAFATQTTDAFLRRQEQAFEVLTATGGTDPCAPIGSLNPCKNDAVCVTTSTTGAGSYTCFCTSAFAGVQCDIALDGQDMLRFVSPASYTLSSSVTSAPLGGIAIVQGLVNAGTLIRLTITPPTAPAAMRGPISASDLALTTYHATTIIICTFGASCQDVLGRLEYVPSGQTIGPAYTVCTIVAEDFDASGSGMIRGDAKHTTAVTLTATFVAASTNGIVFTGIALAGPATIVAVINQAQSLAAYTVVDADILRGYKTDAVSIRMTTINGTILTPTTTAFAKSVADSGRLADINAYLAMSFYKGSGSGDSFTIVLEDEFNRSTIVLPVRSQLANQAPLVQYAGLVTGNQYTVFSLPGFSVIDDAMPEAVLNMSISSVLGVVTLVPSVAVSEFTANAKMIGTIAQLNQALRNLRYTQADALAPANDIVTVVVNDGGASGFGSVPKIGTGSVTVVIDVQRSLPQQMASPVATMITSSAVTLTWTPRPSSSVLYADQNSYTYTVQIATLTGDVLGAYVEAYVGMMRTVTLTTLAPHTIYSVRVMATSTTAGAGPYSAPITASSSFMVCPASSPCGLFSTPFAVPSAASPIIGTVSETSIDVSWVALSSITTYVLSFSVVGGMCPTAFAASQCIGSYTIAQDRFTITGLGAGTNYDIKLVAVNPAGSASAHATQWTQYSAPMITSFFIASPVAQGTVQSNVYHVGNVFSLVFNSRVAAVVGGNVVPNTLSFMQDGASISVGTYSCTWAAIDVVAHVSTLDCRVVSIVGAGAIKIGSLTVTPLASAGITAFGGTLVSSASSPMLTGLFGVSIYFPTIRTLIAPIDAKENLPYALKGLFTVLIATDGTINLNTIYQATVAATSTGAMVRIGEVTTMDSVSQMKSGTVAQINAWLSTAAYIGVSDYIGAASVAITIFPTTGASLTTAIAQSAAQFTVVPVNLAPMIVIGSGSIIAPADVLYTVPLSVVVTDADATRFPTRPLHLTVQVTGGTVSFPATAPTDLSFSVAPSTQSGLISVRGSLTSINLALAQLQLLGTIATNPYTLTYSIEDSDNGGTGFGKSLSATTSQTVTVSCASAMPASVSFASFMDSYAGLRMTFDRYMQYASAVVNCADVFSSVTLMTLGTAPTCSFADHYTLAVVFGTSATIMPTAQLTTIAGAALKRCDGAPNAEALTFTLSVPSARLLPTVDVSGPAHVSHCASPSTLYTYTAQVSSGLGGRVGAYRWTIVGDVNSFPTTVVTTVSTLTFPGSLLPAGGTVTVSVSVVNFLSESSSAALKVVRLAQLVPELSGPTALTVSAQTGFSVAYDASIPTCSTATGTMTFRWTINPAPFKSLDTSSSTTSSLLVLPGTLVAGTKYKFTLTASIVGQAFSSYAADTTITVLDQPLIARLAGGSSRHVGVGSVISFDASSSQLPVQRSSTVQYTWTCATGSGSSCRTLSGAELIGSNEARQTTTMMNVQAHVLPVGPYSFTLTIALTSGGTIQHSTAIQTVTLLASSPVASTLYLSRGLLAAAASDSINTRSMVVIRTTQAHSTSTHTYSWAILSGSTREPIKANRATRTTLVLNPDQTEYFVSGSTYTVELTVQLSTDQSTVSTSTISFYVNSAPKGGSISVDRVSGTAVVDQFTFGANGFTDLESHAPFGYQFFYVDRTGFETALGSESVTPSITTILPQGAGADYALVVGVKVIDRLRGFATYTTTVRVTPTTLTNVQIMTAFTAAIQGKAPIAIVQSVNIYAALLNANTAETTAGQDQSQLRTPLLAALASNIAGVPASTALSTLNAFLGSANIRQASLLTATLSTLLSIQTRIASDPSQVDDHMLEDHLFQVYANILASNAQVSTTTASAMIVAGRRLLATTNGENTQICSTSSCTDAAANQQASLDGIVAGLDSVEARLVETGDYQTREKTDLSLTIYRDDKTTAQSSTVNTVDSTGTILATAGVTVSANYITGFASAVTYVDFRMVLMSGPDADYNPYQSLQTTLDTVLVTAPVMYFDLTDQDATHITGLSYASNGISVVLPIKGAGCTGKTAAECMLQCVTWDAANAYTPASVDTVSNNGTHIFCRPLATPLLISALAIHTTALSSSTGAAASSSTGSAASSSTADVSSADSSSSSTGAVSTTGADSSSTGDAATTGDATSSTGSSTTTSTGAADSTGAVDGSTGDVTTSTGDANTSTGDATTSTGSSTSSTGAATTSTGDATTSTGDATTSTGSSTSSTGSSTTSTGDATTSTGAATSSTGAATTSTGAATTSTGSSTSSTGASTTSTGDATTSTGSSTSSTGSSTTSTGSSTTSTGTSTTSSTGTVVDVSSTGASTTSTGSSGQVVFGAAKVDFVARFNSTNIPSNLDALLVTDIAASTGFAASRITVTHVVLNCAAAAPTVCAGLTEVAVSLAPASEVDTSADVAGQTLANEINCADAACIAALSSSITFAVSGATIMDGVVNAIQVDGANSIVIGSAVFTSGSSLSTGATSYGSARADNTGFYILGAILVLAILLAIAYFVFHKAPLAEGAMVLNKRAPMAESGRGAGSDAADAEAAEEAAEAERMRDEHDAANDAAAAAESQPIMDEAGQMDYKSVFALKNNVLKQEDPVDDNDVHFVLHQ